MKRKEIYFDGLMHEMVHLQCSDLHFDVTSLPKLLFRRHKINVKELEVPDLLGHYDYLRFKAGFDLSKGSLPQTGAFTYMVNEMEYHLRFSCFETPVRKHGVLRILNMNAIDSLEKSVPQKTTYNFIKRQFKARNGIILFSGMTGSGKSTTMFNALRNEAYRQIFTLENPIETLHDFCVQLELNEHQAITFESGLNQLLRHDPDIIVMGEIRSEDDLKQCIRSGLSGHLVTSTIHAGSLENTIHRLLDLNVGIYDLKMCLLAIIYQEMEVIDGVVQVSYKTANKTTITKILDGIPISK